MNFSTFFFDRSYKEGLSDVLAVKIPLILQWNCHDISAILSLGFPGSPSAVTEKHCP